MDALAECVNQSVAALTAAAERSRPREDLAEDPDAYKHKAALIQEQLRSFREGLDDDAAEQLLAAAQDILGVVCRSLWVEAAERCYTALGALGQSLSRNT